MNFGVKGSFEDIASIMFPSRYDGHVIRYRWNLYLKRMGLTIN